MRTKTITILTSDLPTPPIHISHEKIIENIHKIQDKANIPYNDRRAEDSLGACQLDIEMETGTGKTYVYIKTMFELNRKYGWSKFIVVVPSIAIREGVKKSFEETQDHFMSQYGQKAHFFIYNSKKLTDLETFSGSAGISVMIINIQAFNARGEDARRIKAELDEFQSRKPIDVIAKNNPILIMDEPQKMEGKATQDSLKEFNPLFVINYSATHKVIHHTVYVLDALDAYNRKLVKKIEVKGFTLHNLPGTNGYLFLSRIDISSGSDPVAMIELEVKQKNAIKRKICRFSQKDDLYEQSGHLEQYRDNYVISEINAIEETVSFLNGVVLHKGQVYSNAHGEKESDDDLDIRRVQIRETIKSHLEKEKALYPKGIKVLSLFFIDEVKKYRQYDEEDNPHPGIYGKIFEEEYVKCLDKFEQDNPNLVNLSSDSSLLSYRKYLDDIKPNETHQGYFSIDKKGRMVNPSLKRNSFDSDDVNAYELIIKRKDLLLSMKEKTRFIFSHSALREGWDNPNIFQICTLKHSKSDVSRHQEVGRGLRLCVNQDGQRMDATTGDECFREINRLTVIANESYEDFVSGLQTSINESLRDRVEGLGSDFFTGKTVSLFNSAGVSGDKKTFTKEESKKLYYYLIINGYIDINERVTEKYLDDTANGSLAPLPNEFLTFTTPIHELINNKRNRQKGIEVIDGNRDIQTIDTNENFQKKEFMALWNEINHRYRYKVTFDSKALVDKAVKAINEKLTVRSLSYTLETGSMSRKVTREELEKKEGFTEGKKTHTETIDSYACETPYDLLGKIREETHLTRRTIADILLKIDPKKFMLYGANPEDFINNVSSIINDEKATMFVEHITYFKTDGTYDSSIFTIQKSNQEINELLKNKKASDSGKKSVQDCVFFDSQVEQTFAQELEKSDQVIVYAKLPRGFKIPTPVGEYSPDWAIVFKNGNVSNVYFIAETKGSMNSMELKPIEKAKIKCAENLFNNLSGKQVRYAMVNSFVHLMNILQNKA